MYTVMLLDLKSNKRFDKTFRSPYLMNKFINKCRYSKNLKVLGIINPY